jgi:hypothetical protein
VSRPGETIDADVLCYWFHPKDWLKNDQKVLSLCSVLIYQTGRWINENPPK